MPVDHTPSTSVLKTSLALRAAATLSPDARKRVEDHVTQADRLLADVFRGITTWRVRGSDEVWVRAVDLAVVMDVDTSSVAESIRSAELRGELLGTDVRRNATDNDLETSIGGKCPDSDRALTTSPRGVTLLSLRGVRLLVMGCRGERGVRFRTGLDRALAFAAEAERTILALVIAEAEASVSRRAHVGIQEQAHRTIQAMLAAGRKRIPRALLDQALGKAPAPPRAPSLRLLSSSVSRPPEPTEPDWPTGFTLNTANMADGMGWSWERVKKLLQQTGMYGDPAWHLTGDAWVMTASGALRKEARHRLRAGAPLELQRRLNPLFAG